MSSQPPKIAHYEIAELIGEGGMSCVYRARNPEYKVDRAIKTIRVANHTGAELAELERRFANEAHVGAILDHHAHIVQVFDKGRDGAMAYMVMELVQGQDLNKLLVPGQPLPVGRALAIVGELLLALDHAHRKGVIHRDIKPANLMIDAHGHVKLTDFGIARIANSQDFTQVGGTAAGTPRFMSPEQISGDLIDSRTDLWSAGVLLYLLLTGTHPFNGTDHGLADNIKTTPALPPSQRQPALPPALDAVLAKALHKSRHQRYSSAAEFAAALRGLADDTVILPAGRSGPAKQAWIQRPAVMVAAAAAVVLAGLVAWYALAPGSNSTPEVAARQCPPTQVWADGQCACPPGSTLDQQLCVPATAALAARADAAGNPAACAPPAVLVGADCVPCDSLKSNPLLYTGLGCDRMR